jgi:hypothetical protein
MNSKPVNQLSTLSDAQLLAYLEPDLLPADARQAIAKQLHTDATLRTRVQRLHAQLHQFRAELTADAPAVPLNPHAMQRWQQALRNERLHETQIAARTRFTFAALACAAVCVWLVPALIRDGSLYNGAPSPAVAAQPASPDASPDASTNAGAVAFASYARVASSQIKAQQISSTEVEALIAQHQLLERLAQRNGRDDVARLLRGMQPLLQDLLAAPLVEPESTDVARYAERAALIAQLEFEYACLLTKTQRRTSNSSLKNEVLMQPDQHVLGGNPARRV